MCIKKLYNSAKNGKKFETDFKYEKWFKADFAKK